MTKQTFAEIITVIERAFGVSLDAETRRVWWGLLSELDDAVAMAACLDCCRTSSYPPKPADIWTRCQPPEAVRLRASMFVWSDVLEYLRDRTEFRMTSRDGDLEDFLRRLEYDELDIRWACFAVTALGGVRALKALDARGLTMARRDFERLYLAAEDVEKYRVRRQAAQHALRTPKQAKQLPRTSGSNGDHKE